MMGKTVSRSENHLKDLLAKETDPALLQMTASAVGLLALKYVLTRKMLHSEINIEL